MLQLITFSGIFRFLFVCFVFPVNSYYYPLQYPLTQRTYQQMEFIALILHWDLVACFRWNSRDCLIPLHRNHWSGNVHVVDYLLTMMHGKIILQEPENMILAGRNSMSQLVEIKYTQSHILINWDSFPKLCTMQRILIWCAEKLSLGPSHLKFQQITLSSSHQYATIWINTAVVFQEIWLGAAWKKKGN